MKLTSVEIKNFRLLGAVSISLDELLTLIVGRNNSGKTSVIEIFNRFLGPEKVRLRFEDLSIPAHSEFDKALALWKELSAAKAKRDDAAALDLDKKFRESIPTITLTLHIAYGEEDNLAVLAPFITDLDPARKDVAILIEYGPKDPDKLYRAFSESGKKTFLEFIRPTFGAYYVDRVFAVDAKNTSRRLPVERKVLLNLVVPDFIYAQRHLDDQDASKSEKLARGFEAYYNDNYKSEEVSEELQALLDETGAKWDKMYAEIFKAVIDDLKKFNYPGLSARELAIRSRFEADKILKGNTTVFYKHSADNLLPESYNGLGFKNLIYIILQFVCFVERFKKSEPAPGLHLLFIEEPEVHLHPQMQTAFVRQVRDYVKSKKGWDVQLIITTHSSHIVAEGGFRSVRYFDGSFGTAAVKNLQEFKPTPAEAEEFLLQYMTLNNCELFFADKAVLIEGTAERLLFPAFIRKVDAKHRKALSSQYFSVIEVGGAYAHNFKSLLEFLALRTLIITDIDAIAADRTKCKVSEGAKTSNQTLIQWLPKKESLPDLTACTAAQKESGLFRVAYQEAESADTPCGRSFEEAFILKNAAVLAGRTDIKSIPGNAFKNLTAAQIKAGAYELAEKVAKKSDFAFDVMLLDGWEVPKYIEDGILWVERNG